ncbi:MAG: sulfatase [Comamonas sp.]
MPKQRPNIIYIVADDLGYADLGCYGGRPAAFGPVSPNIDALAKKGMLFTNGYSNSPVCSPTRFALMTMRYQYRLRGGMDEPISSKAKNSPVLGLPPEVPTLPSLLQKSGYTTALIGKWHLGYPPNFGPRKSGYEHFFGIMAGGVDYFSHRSGAGQHDLYSNEDPHHEIGYLTDLLSKRTVQFIDEQAAHNAQTPFFISLHYTAPHWPWETREDYEKSQNIQNLFDLDSGNVATYQKMIHHMDEGIGWITEALRKHGMLDNTLIVFTSDNGGERFSDNWPLVGGKMDLTEGGIRVPWIAHWPQVIPAGTVSQQHCMTMDWSATMLKLAGANPDPDYPLDGQSLAGVLQKPEATFERPLYWRMNHRQQRALRVGPWKYLKVDQHEYLFNIEQDARERANLKAVHPEKFQALQHQWLQWEQEVPAIPEDAAVSLGYSAADMPQR